MRFYELRTKYFNFNSSIPKMSDQPNQTTPPVQSQPPAQQEADNKDEKDPKTGGKKFLKPGGKFNFNFYWIYGIIVAALIISQYFTWNNGGERKISRDKFFNEMLKAGDVDQIKVVNNSVAHVYIKHDRLLKKDEYKDARVKTWGSSENVGPHYYFSIGPAEAFRKDVDEVQSSLPSDQRAKLDYEEDNGGYLNFLINWGPILIFVFFIWMFLYLCTPTMSLS